jgi:two-component system sensor histidine kinase UhpB
LIALKLYENGVLYPDVASNGPVSFKGLFDKSSIGVAFVDLKGYFLQVNPELARIFGYSQEELKKMHFTELTHEEDREKSRDSVQAILSGNIDNFQIEKTYIRKDKSHNCCLVSVTVCKGQDNTPQFLFVQVVEMERMVYFSNDLEKSNALFEEAFDGDSVGKALTNPQTGRFEYVNRSFCDILDYSPQELMEKSLSEITHPYDLEISTAAIRSIMSGKRRNCELQKRILRKDGSIVWVKVVAFIQKDMEGAPRFIVTQITDITSDVLYERQLKKLAEERQAFSMRILNIQEEERKRIARDIHDDFGQILAVMKMEIKMIEKRIPCATASCVGSINGLLTEAIAAARRVSDGLRPPLLDNMGLSAAIDYHLKRTSTTSKIKSEFTSNFKPNSFYEEISLHVFRIFQEAMTNIFKHAKASSVWVSLEHSEENLVLKIADDGLGINSDIIALASLGLISMRERAALLGGEFTICNQENSKGTIVTVSIPLK